MKNMLKLIGLMGIVAILYSGCTTTDSGGEARILGGPIPATSKFAKVTIGMSMRELYDTIGAPNDSKSYPTGKSFIPYYYGSDSVRSEVFYKGEGRITLTGGSGVAGGTPKVYRIEYDPTENGYSK
jgi:hypothetical protein